MELSKLGRKPVSLKTLSSFVFVLRGVLVGWLKATRGHGLVLLLYSSEMFKFVLRPNVEDKCWDIQREREGGREPRPRPGQVWRQEGRFCILALSLCFPEPSSFSFPSWSFISIK